MFVSQRSTGPGTQSDWQVGWMHGGGSQSPARLHFHMEMLECDSLLSGLSRVVSLLLPYLPIFVPLLCLAKYQY